MKNTVGFVCFGEVNTPIERLNMKHDEALAALQAKVENVVDADGLNELRRQVSLTHMDDQIVLFFFSNSFAISSKSCSFF